MTVFNPVFLSVWTSERTNLYICHQLFLCSSCLLLNESFLQCVFFRHFGQKATSPETPIQYTAQAVHSISSIPYILRYLHGLLCKHLILSGLTPVNIQPSVSSQGDHSTNDEGHPLTIPSSCRSCACPVIGCTSQKKRSAMAVETNAIRGPLNSVLNSARPTVCIKPLSECFDEWQLPEGLSRKMSGRSHVKHHQSSWHARESWENMPTWKNHQAQSLNESCSCMPTRLVTHPLSHHQSHLLPHPQTLPTMDQILCWKKNY